MALDPLHRERQLKAIGRALATAPDIQDDLKAKFGYGENMFFYNDLMEYRINNSCEDIAEDLDVKSRYEIESDGVARDSIGRAFRGHHDEEFMSDYRFDGLFGKETNDIIEKIRYELNGQKGGRIGGRIGGRASVETHGDQMRNGGLIGGLIGALASAEAQGKHVWSLEEIVDIHNFREESIGKGRYKTSPCWDDTTAEMNEKYGENWSTSKIKDAYRYNKDKLSDEEE